MQFPQALVMFLLCQLVLVCLGAPQTNGDGLFDPSTEGNIGNHTTSEILPATTQNYDIVAEKHNKYERLWMEVDSMISSNLSLLSEDEMKLNNGMKEIEDERNLLDEETKNITGITESAERNKRHEEERNKILGYARQLIGGRKKFEKVIKYENISDVDRETKILETTRFLLREYKTLYQTRKMLENERRYIEELRLLKERQKQFQQEKRQLELEKKLLKVEKDQADKAETDRKKKEKEEKETTPEVSDDGQGPSAELPPSKFTTLMGKIGTLLMGREIHMSLWRESLNETPASDFERREKLKGLIESGVKDFKGVPEQLLWVYKELKNTASA